MDMSKTLSQIKSFARGKGLPVIPIDAKNVSFISEPSVFYDTILESISRTKSRLALSALYLGVGHKENAIVHAIHNSLQRNPKLDVNIVLDAHRATRHDDKGRSSVTMLKKILKYDNLKLELVDARRNKTFVDTFMGRFQKWNEISSTYHTKMLLFDNDVIMTGANLSEIYFENRQDRYVSIKNCKLLSSYLHLLLNIFGKESDLRVKIDEINEIITRRLIEFEDEPSDSWIIPVIQHGPSGILDSDDFLVFLSTVLPQGAKVHLSSGYFNPSLAVSSLGLESVLAPSESTNGFYRGKGLLKYIPRLYSALHEQFMEVNKRCKLYLYKKTGWSFHAKGIWIEGIDDIYIHHFGSANYNFRSSERDFETQLVLLTTNRKLIEDLGRERKSLWNQAGPVEPGEAQGSNFMIYILSQLLKRFL